MPRRVATQPGALPARSSPKIARSGAATVTSTPSSLSAPERRGPGRARSDASRIAILEATLKLLESTPLQQLSIESIARKAGVGKATIYRWWPSKASVVIDAFIGYHGVHVLIPDNVGPLDALVRHIHLLVEEFGSWAGRIVAQLLAEGQGDPDVLKELRERFLQVRRARVVQLIDEARRIGEFRTDMDAEEQLSLLYAPIYMRLMFQHLPLDRAFADAHCAAMLRMLRAPAGRPVARRRKPI